MTLSCYVEAGREMKCTAPPKNRMLTVEDGADITLTSWCSSSIHRIIPCHIEALHSRCIRRFEMLISSQEEASTNSTGELCQVEHR